MKTRVSQLIAFSVIIAFNYYFFQSYSFNLYVTKTLLERETQYNYHLGLCCVDLDEYTIICHFILLSLIS